MRHFRTLTVLLLATVMTAFVSSCNRGGDDATETADEKFGEMEVVIPEELKDNPEIVEYIEGMADVADSYALLMDEMIEELGGYEAASFEDLNMREKVKFTRHAAEFSMKSAPIMTKWAEHQAKRTMVADELSEEELMALEAVMERFEARMEQIEARHTDYFEGVEEAQ